MNKSNHIDSSESAFSLFLNFKGVVQPLEKMRKIQTGMPLRTSCRQSVASCTIFKT